VTDRGPFIAGRDLDLSRAAAQALGFSGLATVHVEFVEAVVD
jgi:rare lipoprotein A